jgi:predicted Fe-S protein YdhL (DUF1289 family)
MYPNKFIILNIIYSFTNIRDPKLKYYKDKIYLMVSPCKNTKNSCNLNEDNRCTTCNRTIEDIINWSNMKEEEQKERINELREKYNEN